jgi:selenocysteine lyase/cysteine desulfurase
VVAEKVRAQFPVADQLIWLHHAGVSPLCRPAAEAMKALADDALQFASVHYQQWMDAYEAFRVASARLIGSSPREIAIVKNTSEGIATVQLGLNWQAGDKVVAFKEEFPANYYPWKRLEERGVHVEWLSIDDPLEVIDRAARGARLLAISYVNYLSGRRVDLAAIGEICHRHGCFYLVDAIQGLGVFPMDVEAMHIDALAADGHKWLMGPEGCGLLYIRQSRQDEVFPVEFGWTTVAGFNDYASRDMTLRSDAGRYECGTLNTIGVYGLKAAIEFILEVGVDAIGPQVLALSQRLAQGAAAKGYELLLAQPESGIVTFRRADIDSRMVVSQLKQHQIHAAPRQGWVRMSPHFYQRLDEMDAVIAALP